MDDAFQFHVCGMQLVTFLDWGSLCRRIVTVSCSVAVGDCSVHET